MGKLVLTNGKIYVERGVFAQAVCAEGGVIRCVGSNEEVLRVAGGGAEVFDCEGRTVIPGLNDAHCHIFTVGLNMAQLQLSGARSLHEIIERGRRFLAEHPDAGKRGIEGGGWNEDLFTEGERRFPDRHDLDQISSEVPIVVRRVCEHIFSVNTRAIEIMGLTKDSPQFEDGLFEREEDGTPSGVFKENLARARSVLPPYTAKEYGDLYARAAAYAVSRGITSLQSNDVGLLPLTPDEVFRLINDVHAQGRAALRHRQQTTFYKLEDFREYLAGTYARRGDFHPHVEAGPLKLFKDGSLGGRSAALRQAYHDDPGNFGVEALSDADMDVFCRAAKEAGVQVVTHAIGDRAVAGVVGCYARADAQNRLRNVINHCQITDRPLLEDIARNHICVCYQPIFLDYDIHMAEARCGHELASTSYAFGTLSRMGVPIGYSTDSPVEDCNPFPNIYSAVTRMDKEGWPEGGWFPEERVDVAAAIDAYTTGSAYLEFHEGDKGRIQPGFAADMTVLDEDIFTCSPRAIRDILPVMTVIAGEVAYQR